MKNLSPSKFDLTTFPYMVTLEIDGLKAVIAGYFKSFDLASNRAERLNLFKGFKATAVSNPDFVVHDQAFTSSESDG
jgi:hypothetical protein